MRRAPAIVLLTVLCVLAGLGARAVLLHTQERLRLFPGAAAVPPAGPVAPPGGAGAGAAAGAPARAVVLLVDGLSAGDATRLPLLARLAWQGTGFTAAVPLPDWPEPAWGTALTGHRPATHGLVLAGNPRPPAGANVLAAARQAGLDVAAAGGERFLRVVGPWLNRGAFAVPAGWEGTGGPLLAAANRALASGADLVLIHLEGLHTVAHRLADGPAPGAGAPGPGGGGLDPGAASGWPGAPADPRAAWDEALAWTDARLALLLQSVDLDRTNVVVAGTYGSAPGAPHGGPVPVVLAGPGVAPGPAGTGDLRDLAPTLGALLGAVPFPAEGAPHWAALAPGLRLQQAAWAPSQPAPAPGGPAERWRTQALTLWEQVRDQAAWVAGGLVLLLTYVLLALRQPFALPALGGLAVYHVAYYTLFWLTGGRFSPHLPGLEEPGPAFWWDRAVPVAAAMLLAAAVTGWSLGRRGARRVGYAVIGSLHLTLLLLALLGAQGLAFLLFTGWDATPVLPAPGWVVKFGLDAFQATLVGLGAPAWALAAGLCALVSRALAGPPPVTAPAAPRLAAGQPLARGMLRGASSLRAGRPSRATRPRS